MCLVRLAIRSVYQYGYIDAVHTSTLADPTASHKLFCRGGGQHKTSSGGWRVSNQASVVFLGVYGLLTPTFSAVILPPPDAPMNSPTARRLVDDADALGGSRSGEGSES